MHVSLLQISRRFELPPKEGQKTNCAMFLGYTSNMISSGLRETIRYLAEHNMVIRFRCIDNRDICNVQIIFIVEIKKPQNQCD